jgi:hypothetical protein
VDRLEGPARVSPARRDNSSACRSTMPSQLITGPRVRSHRAPAG